MVTKRKKGETLTGTRGVHKGKKAKYLGDGDVRITSGPMKGWVGKDKARIFK